MHMYLFSVVEDLFKSREPVPEMKAIYFMSPTATVFHQYLFIILFGTFQNKVRNCLIEHEKICNMKYSISAITK